MREIRAEYINPYTITKDIVKNIFVIILAFFVGFFGVRAYFRFTYEPVYSSYATIAVSATDSGYYSYSNLSKTIEAASTFQEMFQSSYFKEKLGDITGSLVTGDISAVQIEETNLINISYSCSSPMEAFGTVVAIINNYNVITDYSFNNMIINVISAPTVPTSPSNTISYGNYDKTAALALSFAALVIIVLFSYFRDTVKNESDIEALLDTKLFGVIYHEEKNKTIRSKLRLAHSKDPLLITDILINYKFAESFRIAALKLEYVMKTKAVKTVMITSCGENEGKSTVAVNLALSMASLGKKTLLVDIDLRKPAIYKFFGASNTDSLKGAGEVIRGNASINEAIIRDENSGLYVLCGKQKYRNSSEMLSTQRFEKLVDSLKEQFDIIIFDTSPTTLVSDAEIIAVNIDSALVIVRQDVAPVPEINDMIDSVTQSGAKVIGCILNDVSVLPKLSGNGDAAVPEYEKISETEARTK